MRTKTTQHLSIQTSLLLPFSLGACYLSYAMQRSSTVDLVPPMGRARIRQRAQGLPVADLLITMREFRCGQCGKLLGKYAMEGSRLLLQIFCRRCGSIAVLRHRQ
jgi:phage FluMu protein Com